MWRYVVGLLLLVSFSAPALAQFDTPKSKPEPKGKAKSKATLKGKEQPAIGEKLTERGVQLDTSEKQLWRCGVQVKALGGPCAGLFGTIAVPTDWPEQTVKVVREEITPNVRSVDYRTLDQGVRQLVFNIPTLANGEGAVAIITFEVE